LVDRAIAEPAEETAVPPPERSSFYVSTLRRLLDDDVLRRDMSVLVVCAGEADRDVFLEVGFEDVTISNLAGGSEEMSRPFRWAAEDAEDLSFEDGSFDLVAVSGGLHHCRSPHRALLEMYRVARQVVFVLESRDSRLMRAAIGVGIVDEYELTAVAAHGFQAGGVRDTSAPNFVYRWTEREVRKAIASNAPHARHRILFFHELELPMSVLGLRFGRPGELAARVAEPALGLVTKVFPSQANLFAFVVLKPVLPRDLQPWMKQEDGQPVADEAWIRGHLAAPPAGPSGGE
jgi:SAM-dependent methyltransferase